MLNHKTTSFRDLPDELLREALGWALERADIAGSLRQAVEYALIPSGKLLRPHLTLALAKDMGVDIAPLAKAAICLELIHCASLVHDDLPAVDNDHMRRGKPSTHVAYGEATAIFVGDYLVSHALRLLTELDYKAEVKTEFVRVLAAANSELVYGQQLDLLDIRSEAALIYSHARKTGALFAAAAQFAVIASGKAHLLDLALELGERIGCFFQLSDDFLDSFGSEELLGKPVGSDQKNQRKTFFSDGQEDGVSGQSVFSSRRGIELLKEQKEGIEALVSELECLRLVHSTSTYTRTRKWLGRLFSRVFDQLALRVVNT